MPAEIRRWNWGAFLITPIWGIGNRVWISLLTFLPLANFVMPFVLGVRGNEWAWQKRRWNSVEHFRGTQRAWAWWGLGITIVGIGVFVPLTVLGSFDAVGVGDEDARLALRDSATAAAAIYTDLGTFDEATPDALASRDPGLTFVGPDSPSDGPSVVSVMTVEPGIWVAAARSRSGTCFFIGVGSVSGALYGADSSGGECTARRASQADFYDSW